MPLPPSNVLWWWFPLAIFELDSIVQITKTLEEVQGIFQSPPKITRSALHNERPNNQLSYFLKNLAPDLHRPGIQNHHSAQHRYTRCPFQQASYFSIGWIFGVVVIAFLLGLFSPLLLILFDLWTMKH